MAGKTKTSNIGHGMHTMHPGQRCTDSIGAQHGVTSQGLMTALKQALLLGGGQHPHSQRFGQVQQITRLGTAIQLEMLKVNQAVDRQAEDWLWRIDGVSSPQ